MKLLSFILIFLFCFVLFQCRNQSQDHPPVSFKMYEDIQKLYLSSTHTGVATIQVTKLVE